MQALAQSLEERPSDLGIEPIRPVGSTNRWQRAGNAHRASSCVGGISCEPPGERREHASLRAKSLRADVKRNECVAVRRDYVRSRADESLVDARNEFRCFDQRKCGPFGLAKRRADALQ